MKFYWGLLWNSKSKFYGKQEWIMWNNCFPLLFKTRKEAREFNNKHNGYIKTRKDLRSEPHGWRLPKPIMVKVSVEKL